MNRKKDHNFERESFVFYRSFFTQIEMLENVNIQNELYRAICVYAMCHETPEFTEIIAQVLWQGIKPQLDANWKRFYNGLKGAPYGPKGAPYGNKGGAPKGNQNACKDDKQRRAEVGYKTTNTENATF